MKHVIRVVDNLFTVTGPTGHRWHRKFETEAGAKAAIRAALDWSKLNSYHDDWRRRYRDALQMVEGPSRYVRIDECY